MKGKICSKFLRAALVCLIVGSTLGWFPGSVSASPRTHALDISIDSGASQTRATETSPIASQPVSSPATGTWEVTGTIQLSGTERPLQIAISGGKAYVSRNPGHFTVVDLSTDTAITTISFDPYPGATPHYIGISGGKAYVALGNLGSDGQLAVINIADYTVSAYIPVGADPYGVATFGQKVYVTNNVWWSSGDPATVKVVDANTNSVVASIPVGINPTSIAIDPVTGKAYVTNRNDLSKSVSVIDTTSNSVTTTIPINNPPAAVAISGNRAYVATTVNMPNGTVEVIDIGADSVVSSIPVGRDSWGIAASDDYVFVANQSSSTVSVIEVATSSVVATVNVGDDPTHIAVDPSTNRVYVTNQGDNTISIIEFKETPQPTNEPPTVSITSPLNNATVSGIINVQGTASDPDGNSQLQMVEVKIDAGTWVQASGTTSWSYSWDTTTVPDGQHSIYARSYDGQAYSSEASIVVSVNNVVPTPSLVDVGISSETEAWPPKTFLQAEPGDRINTWYRISYPGSLIRVKLRTTIFDPNGNEIDNLLNDPILQISGPTEDTGWVGVTFEVPVEAVLGTYDVRFSVWSEDGAQEYDALVKSGWIRLGLEEGPDIGSVDSIDFGNVTLDNNSDKTTTIYNDGSTTLMINSITRTAGSQDFTYISPSTPFSVGAGSSQTITIRFAPGSEGSKSAVFNINSNDPDEGDVTFNVSGNGVIRRGTINVTSDPSGASFTISGPTNYSGITPWSTTDAPVGTYTITWGFMTGYQTPPPESKTLTQDGTISFYGLYLSLYQLPATEGKISWFSSEESGQPGAWGEWLGEKYGKDDATKYWYCAMRWPYYNPDTGFSSEEAKRWWHNQKILVTNPKNGKQVVLLAKDWGPAKWTGRGIDVSKTAIDVLEAKTDDIVYIEFAPQDALIGPYPATIAYSLTAYIIGSGTVEPSPLPVAAGYAPDTLVTLRADPAPGWQFERWSGTNNNNINPTTVIMNSSKSITAYFTAAEKFRGENATTLSGYYLAWGKSLPPLSERAKIYEALGLGPASEYTGTAEENTRLLDALKQRQICPSTGEEVGWVAPSATLVELIQQEATGGVPVTVDGQLYVILTLRNRIDPGTLKVVPGSGTTKVYVDAENYPVSEPDIAQKIGLIDDARRWQGGAGSPQSISERIMHLWDGWYAYEQIKVWQFPRELLAKAPAIFIRAYVSGGALTLEDFADFATDAVTLYAELFTDPIRLVEVAIEQDLWDAEANYFAARKIALRGGITDYETAYTYLRHFLEGAKYYEEPANYLLAEIGDINKGMGKEFMDYFIDVANEISGGYYGNVQEARGRLMEIIQIAQYMRMKNTGATIVEEYLSKLLGAAPYTLELANSPRIAVKVHSPVELRVYDSQGRVTGIVNGEVRSEIPYSVYYDTTVTIFSPTDSYKYEVVGTGEGSYDVIVTSVADEVSTFTLTNVPTAVRAVHQYTIDWDTLAKGEKGTTMKIDADGDGTFERVINLSGIEEGKGGLPSWIWFAVGVVVALMASFVVWRRMIRKQDAKA